MDTKIHAKPNASVNETPAAETEFLYCIEHEGMFKVENGPCGKGHLLEVNTDEGKEIEFCCFEGGYAFVPPPANPPEAIEVGEGFFDGDWAAQPEDDGDNADEVDVWEERED